jgi:hypothetical protein
VSKGTYKKERGDVCVATTKVKNKGGVLYMGLEVKQEGGG